MLELLGFPLAVLLFQVLFTLDLFAVDGVKEGLGVEVASKGGLELGVGFGSLRKRIEFMKYLLREVGIV